jgi:hypothetical protein
MDNAFSVDQKPNATGSDVSRGEPNGATAHTAEAVDEVAQEWNEGSRAEPRRARRKQEPTERQAQPNFHHEAREEHEEEPFLLSFSKLRVPPRPEKVFSAMSKFKILHRAGAMIRHVNTSLNVFRPEEVSGE